MYYLIITAKLSNVHPQAWLADVLSRVAEHPVQKLDELLPWNWQPRSVACSKSAYPNCRNREAAPSYTHDVVLLAASRDAHRQP